MLSIPPVSTMPAAHRGLNAGTAEPIDGQRRHFDRHAGLQRDVPCPINRIAAGLQHVAHDGVVHPLRFDAGFLKRRTRRDGTEFECGNVLQRADVLGHRRTRAAKNENLFRHVE
jgi:hypothetical protein